MEFCRSNSRTKMAHRHCEDDKDVGGKRYSEDWTTGIVIR